MKVDFDGIRHRGINAYNSLIRELNRHIQEDGETFGDGIDFKDTFTVGDIRNELEELADYIVSINCLEDPENDIKMIDSKLEELIEDK